MASPPVKTAPGVEVIVLKIGPPGEPSELKLRVKLPLPEVSNRPKLEERTFVAAGFNEKGALPVIVSTKGPAAAVPAKKGVLGLIAIELPSGPVAPKLKVAIDWV